ncbi:MAG: glycosyltransferase family 39 protein, partial [Chloroflexi bacterium]|nr:glycosyltransferase family 39 protein [Chloroflexota bacterium]
MITSWRKTLRAGWPLILIGLVAAVEGLWLYQTMLIRWGALGWDEGTHSTAGLLLTRDLQHGSLAAFLIHSYQIVQYPFLGHWMRVPFLLIADTETMARLPSLVAFLALPFVAYGLARRVAPPEGRTWAGPLAALLMLTSPVEAYLSTLVMVESAGALLALLALWAYLPVIEREDLPSGVRAGLLGAAAFFVKYNYGFHLLVAFGLMALWRLVTRARSGGAPGHTVLLMSATAALAIWLAVPLNGKLGAFIGSACAFAECYNQGWAAPLLQQPLAHLLFYPLVTLGVGMQGTWLSLDGAIAFDAAQTGAYFPSLLLAAAAMAALVWRLRNKPGPSELACLLSVGVVFAVMTVHPNKQIRHIASGVAALQVVSAVALGTLVGRLSMSAPGMRRRLLLTAVGVAVASNAVMFPLRLASLAEDVTGPPAVHAVLTAIERYAGDSPALVVVGVMGKISPGLVEWKFLQTRPDGPWPNIVQLVRRPPGPDGGQGSPAMIAADLAAAIKSAPG